MQDNTKLRYNERAWAVELISYLNSILDKGRPIKRVSGEYSLSIAGGYLFPDILLFGDASSGQVLQGWELKMPETPINNSALLSNAEEKSRALGLDSFVVWNLRAAHLYRRHIQTDSYDFVDALWENVEIQTRSDIQNRPETWQNGAEIIIDKLNDFFATGTLRGVSPDMIFSEGRFVEQVLSCQSMVKEYLREKRKTDNRLDAKIKVWWSGAQEEYPGESSPYAPLAYMIILKWFNRFIFTNIARAYDTPMRRIEQLKGTCSVEDALVLFRELNSANHVSDLLIPDEFDNYLPDDVWNTFISFNEFLLQFNFSGVDKSILQNVLKAAILSSIKKSAGLYSTPDNLALLLVHLSLQDKTADVIDPFCGTGTIVRAVLEVKSDYGIPGYEAFETTWGCDKFAFPVQLAVLSALSSETIGKVMRIFTCDALNLNPGNPISLFDPAIGKERDMPLPVFGAVISNFPFIEFEKIKDLNEKVIQRINKFYTENGIRSQDRLDGRGDFYSYLPFILYDLLKKDGIIGFIASNSWIATKWGQKFRNLLRKFYDILYIVTSASGRWFASTDIVTNLIICQKKNDLTESKETRFVSLHEAIDDEEGDLELIAAEIISENKDSERITINTITCERMNLIDELKLGWNFCFADSSWFFTYKDKFRKLSDFFAVSRGERRGCNELFYPADEFIPLIETEFLQPIVKNLHGYYSLTVSEERAIQAFCCSLSIEELQKRGKNGTLAWIRRFEKGYNGSGKPLPQALGRKKQLWYQFEPDNYADLVLANNPDRRLFFAAMKNPLPVDQRLIVLVRKSGTTCLKLSHALLNSTASLFFIEALGFGRGLGALDLNSTKIKNSFFVPNIDMIDKKNRERILECFEPLLNRDVLPVQQEIEREDRAKLDAAIFNALEVPLSAVDSVRQSLLTLYNIRKSVE